MTVNPNMITLAREARNLTQLELGVRINLHKGNVSRLESGDARVSDQILSALSEALSYPPQFFQQSGSIMPTNLAYRMRQKVPQRLITPIEARINIQKRHIQFLTRALEKSLPKLPLYQAGEKNNPVRIAQLVRKQWKIDEPVINDLTRIMEANGIAINHFDFGTERVDSRTMLTDDKYPIIFLNKSLLGDRQRFSLAFELGHLIMHTYSIAASDTDINHEANQFAAELLMPAKEIKKDFDRDITLPVLAELKRKWKVSMIALLYRADDLGYFTANQKRYLLQQFNQLKIRRREPQELDVPIEQPQLIRNWITEYKKKNKLGVSEMAALLSLYVDEYLDLYGGK